MRWLPAMLLAALAMPAMATADTAPTLADIEDEVMCPICGTLLELAQAPQADRQRVFINRLIRAGRDKEQIKEALVAEYGEEVLALPRGSGFSLSAYVVPIAGLALAAVALGFGIARWRRSTAGDERDPPSPPGPEDESRLEADMARYDL